MRVGIVGCGGIATSHLDAYKKLGCEIGGLTDVSLDAAESKSKVYGGAIFADCREMIDGAKPDVISICSPPVVHEEAAVYALEHGVSVLCEKPMAFDAASARRMHAAAEASEGLLMPAFRHRMIPANVRMKDLIASGKLGDIVLFNNVFCGPAFSMEGTWFTRKSVAGGGCLLDTNSHSVDLFRFLVGEIADQKGVTHRRFATTDVEDSGIICLKAENGAVGSVESAFTAGVPSAFIDIIGTKGRVSFDYFSMDKLRVKYLDAKDWEEESVEAAWGFVEEIEHFLSAVKGECELAITSYDGLRVMEVIEAVYEGEGT